GASTYASRRPHGCRRLVSRARAFRFPGGALLVRRRTVGTGTPVRAPRLARADVRSPGARIACPSRRRALLCFPLYTAVSCRRDRVRAEASLGARPRERRRTCPRGD